MIALLLISLVAAQRQVGFTPGALNLYSNLTSFQHMFELFLPIIIEDYIYKHAFETNIHVNKWDYSLSIDNATFSHISSPSPKMVFEQLPDFNQTYLHVTVGDIDAELALGCKFKMLHLIPAHVTYLTL